jgi:hypothetical protein
MYFARGYRLCVWCSPCRNAVVSDGVKGIQFLLKRVAPFAALVMALVGMGTLRPVQGHNGNYEYDIFPVDQHKHDPFEGDMSPNWVVEEGENDTRNGCYDDDIEAGAGRDYSSFETATIVWSARRMPTGF